LELVHLAEISSHPSRAFEHKYYIRAKWEFSNIEDFPKLSEPNHRPLWPIMERTDNSVRLKKLTTDL